MKRSLFVPTIVAAACFATVALTAQTPTAAQKPTLEGYPAVGSPSTMKLIDAGAQPRKALRYAVPATFKGRMMMSMSINANINVGGMAMPMNLPTINMTADVAASSVAPNGDISFSTAFSEASIDQTSADANPAMAGALQGLQGAIKGIKGTATISNRGIVKAVKIDMGEAGAAQQMTNELTSQLENLATPLPEEAVGVGAKWEVRQAVSSAGQVQFQKITNEVTAMDASSFTVKSTVEITIPAQAVTNAALPGDVQLDKSTGTGSGTSVIRLDSLIPTGEQTITSTMAMTMTMGGQTQAMSMENTIKIKITPGK